MSRHILIAFWAVFIFLLSCSLDENITSIPSGNNKVNSVRLYFSKPSQLDSLVVNARAMVSAPDMDTITADLIVSADHVEGTIENIPAGIGRKFEIFTYDADTNLTYYGSTMADVPAGQTITLQIVLYPVDTTGTVIIVGTFAPFPPTGGKITFEGNQFGNFDIYLMNPDGTQLVSLTNTPETDELRPRLSSDHQKVLFTRRYPDGRHRPFILDTSTGNEQEVPVLQNNSKVVAYDWSPDMEKIVLYAWVDGDPEIFTYNLTSGETVQLTDNDAIDWAPHWSPDGQWIGYQSNESGIFKIYLVHPDGTQNHMVLPNDTTSWTSMMFEQKYADFSPDGSVILFYGRQANEIFYDLYKVNIDGSNLQQLTFTPGISEIQGCFSPDGQKIVFILNQGPQFNIFMMNHNGTGISPVLITNYKKGYPHWK